MWSFLQCKSSPWDADDRSAAFGSDLRWSGHTARIIDSSSLTLTGL
jgi:hypothetical protein